jgi:large subunit ribosomal protein L10
MPVTKAKKTEQVETLKKEFSNVSGAVVGTFAHLTVAQDFELRKAVRGAGGKYRVIKNTLAERAAQGTNVEAALQGLEGVTSIAYTEGDPVALAKALAKYVKDNPQFSFKAGVLEGKALSVKEVEALATMPSKEEIYSKLLFLINAPAQRLVTVMNAVGRDLAVVVNQAVKENKFAAGGEAATAAAPASGEAALAGGEAAPASGEAVASAAPSSGEAAAPASGDAEAAGAAPAEEPAGT